MARAFFERKFRQNLERVDKRLQAYLAEPSSEKNIHDVRTSIRRLDATFSLLPKKARRRYRSRIEKYREFLRANSKARDYDVIGARISALGLGGADLQKKKEAELARAVRLARPLKKLPFAQLAGALGGKTGSRIDKVARRLIERIRKEIPVVLSDSSRVEELHQLRKDFRKLRYILGMIPAGDKRRHMRKVARAAGKDVDLKEQQALLGLIHDSDVTIEYLQGIRAKNATRFLNKELAVRRQLYRKFVRHMKN